MNQLERASSEISPESEQEGDWEYDDSESDEDESEDEHIEEVKDSEETIDLKDVLRLVEQSAKAIQHMNEHQFSTVWSQCSKNTYGKKSEHVFVRTLS